MNYSPAILDTENTMLRTAMKLAFKAGAISTLKQVAHEISPLDNSPAQMVDALSKLADEVAALPDEE